MNRCDDYAELLLAAFFCEDEEDGRSHAYGRSSKEATAFMHHAG